MEQEKLSAGRNWKNTSGKKGIVIDAKTGVWIRERKRK